MDKPRLLLLLTRNPRTDPRALEGIRVSAGVGAWQRIDLRLYLTEDALAALEPAVEELEEGADFMRYLSVVAEAEVPIHIPEHATLSELAVPGIQPQPTSSAQLAQLAAESNYVMRF